MRLILLALLPAALAACGNDGGGAAPEGTMPAPEPTMEEAADAAAAESGTTGGTPAEAMQGEWSTASDRGDPSATFTSGDEALFTVICRSGAAEGEAGSLVVQRMIDAEMAGDTIDFLTSAGNASVEAVALDTETPTIGGSIDPAANGVATLANANDAIRVRTGDNEIVIPASDEMKTVINDCRPEPEVPAEDEEAVEGEETEEDTGEETTE